MHIKAQIIERDDSTGGVTVRYTTHQAPAEVIDPQWVDGAAKRRRDGLVARCRSDLHIVIDAATQADAGKLEQRLRAHIPFDTLAQFDPSVPTAESFLVLPEQSVKID